MDDYLPLTSSPSGEISERMQALLSRAVDDQVNEQRQVQSLLTEVRAALAQVQDEVRSVPSDDLRRRLDQHVRHNDAALSQLQERLEGMVRAVSTSAQVLQGISGQLDRLTESVAEQAASAAGREPVEQLRTDVGQLGGRLDAIERLLGGRLDGIEALLRAELPGLQVGIRGDFESVRAATGESTRSLAQHIDNAVLVLAEALLRRPSIEPAGSVQEADGADRADSPEPVQADSAAAEHATEPRDERNGPAIAAHAEPQAAAAQPGAPAQPEAGREPAHASNADRTPESANEPARAAAEPARAAAEAAGPREPDQQPDAAERDSVTPTAVSVGQPPARGPFGDPPPGVQLPPAAGPEGDPPPGVQRPLAAAAERNLAPEPEPPAAAAPEEPGQPRARDELSDPLPEDRRGGQTALDAPIEEVTRDLPWDDPLSASFDADGTQWELSRLLDDTRPASGASSPTDLRIHHAASGGESERSTVDEFAALGDPAWDLEQALFGGRSRSAEPAPTGPESGGTAADAASAERGQSASAGDADGADSDDDRDDDGEPRRRPWWRPGS